MQPNPQSSFQKLNADNSYQKTRKIRYYIFEVLPNFIVSLYFAPNILSRIVVEFLQHWNKQITSCPSPQCLVGHIQVQKSVLIVATDQMPDHI